MVKSFEVSELPGVQST
jgi:coatomer subunit beta'